MISNQKHMENFIHYCNDQKEQLNANCTKFKKTGEEWEYVTAKIRMGIIEMASTSIRTILSLATNPDSIPSHHWLRKEVQVAFPEDPTKRFTVFFTQFLDHVAIPWKTSLEKAETHNDTEMIEKERIKLEYLEEIKSVFSSICAEKKGE